MNDETSAAQSNKNIKKRNSFLAVILSLLCPGLGHIYSGDLKKGIIIYFAFNILVLIIFILSMLFSMALMILILVVVLFIVFDVIKLSKRNKEYELKSYNRWYVYITILI
ncbi:hypothetical protein D4R20_01445, partial [bacterium]